MKNYEFRIMNYLGSTVLGRGRGTEEFITHNT
jgi:hypothetical protein